MPPLVTYASGQRCVVSPTECRLPCPPISVLSRTFRGLEGPVARSELLGQWSAPRQVLQGVPFRVSVPSYLPCRLFRSTTECIPKKEISSPLATISGKTKRTSSLGILLFDLYNSSQFFQRHSATRLFRKNCPPDGTRAGSFPGREDANVFLRASKARWQTMGRR